MDTVKFRLQPFVNVQATTRHPIVDVEISGAVLRTGSRLTVNYQVKGDIEGIVWPALNAPACRKDALWRHSCLELFVSSPGSKAYDEYNFSPSGDWAVYHFESYRQLIADAVSIRVEIEQAIETHQASFWVNADIDSAWRDMTLELSITAVLEWVDGEMGYFALMHCADKPDFHRRESFAMISIAEKIGL